MAAWSRPLLLWKRTPGFLALSVRGTGCFRNSWSPRNGELERRGSQGFSACNPPPLYTPLPRAPNPSSLTWLSGSKARALHATVRPKGSMEASPTFSPPKAKAHFSHKIKSSILGLRSKGWRDGGGWVEIPRAALSWGRKCSCPCLSALPGPLMVGGQGRDGRHRA